MHHIYPKIIIHPWLYRSEVCQHLLNCTSHMLHLDIVLFQQTPTQQL